MLFAMLLTSTLAGAPQDLPLVLAKARMAAALRFAAIGDTIPDTPSPAPAPDDVKPKPGVCSRCNGTGRVRSGDGLFNGPCADCNGTGRITADPPLSSFIPEDFDAGTDTSVTTDQPLEAEIASDQADQTQTNKKDITAELTAADLQLATRPAVLKMTKPRTRQLLFFTAPWCTNCGTAKATVQSLKTAGWDVTEEDTAQIRLVDISQQPAVMRQFAITAIPALVVTDNGVVRKRLVGDQVTALSTFAMGALYTAPAATLGLPEIPTATEENQPVGNDCAAPVVNGTVSATTRYGMTANSGIVPQPVIQPGAVYAPVQLYYRPSTRPRAGIWRVR